MRDVRIRGNSPGEFRGIALGVDDVTGGLEADMVNGYGIVEKVKVFVGEGVEPLKVPYVGRMFSMKVSSISDPFLVEAIEVLSYFNPSLDELGLKKMVEYVVLVLTRRVGLTVDSLEPVLKYEDLEKVVKGIYRVAQFKPAKGVMDKYVVFANGSTMSASDRRLASQQVRSSVKQDLVGKLIHLSAVDLVEKMEPTIVVSKPKVLENIDQEDRVAKHINSLRGLSRFMGSNTVELLQVVNEGRPFKKVSEFDKYNKFLEMPPMRVADAVSELKVSRSTIIKFKKLADGY